MWVDNSVFGKDHIYQTPTCHQVYRGTAPYDPEVCEIKHLPARYDHREGYLSAHIAKFHVCSHFSFNDSSLAK